MNTNENFTYEAYEAISKINSLKEENNDSKVVNVKESDVISALKVEDNNKVVNEINELKKFNVNTIYIGKSKNINELFLNKTFVLTGTLSKMTRDEARELIETLGGKNTNSVSKKTDVVIVGDNPGSKYNDAIKLGIEVWKEEEFLNNIGGKNE